MIKNILLLVLTLLVLWLARDKYMTVMPMQSSSKELHEDIKQTISYLKEHVATVKHPSSAFVPKSSIVNTHKTKPSTKQDSRLSRLLSQNKFYDALSYYLEHTTLHNRQLIEQYLTSYADTHPMIALKYMQVFLDNEPQSDIGKAMVNLYLKQKNYKKAITMLIQIKERYSSEKENDRLSVQLRESSILYIETLTKQKEYLSLISFLEEMSAYDNSDNFYSFRLAQLYIELDKTSEAIDLLETLKYDDVYAENVESLMNELNTKEENRYKYAIPLKKYGDHYVVNILFNGVSFNLLLDTGATFILLDEDKASMLEVLRDDLTLQTAGDDISAQLCNASTMQMGNLELSNLKVTVARFKREGFDGLLGMNFFKQFVFFINQEENVLYLNPK